MQETNTCRTMTLVKSHPFWQACTGSELHFRLATPPHNCHIAALNIIASTISKPTVYEVYFTFTDGHHGHVHYVKKPEALSIINKEWMRHYADQTILAFIEHTYVDLRTCLSWDNDDISSSSDNTESPYSTPEGSPRNITPRIVRGFPKLTLSPRLLRSPQKSPTCSPQHTPPRSPRQTSPSGLFARQLPSSPRTLSSPREWLSERMSQKLRQSSSSGPILSPPPVTDT